MAVKGAIFLSKSAAVKAAIVKYGSYLLMSKGIATTVSAGLAISTAAGYFTTAKSLPENTKKGFTQIINGIAEGSIADFLDGVYKLSKVYTCTDSLLSDLGEIIDTGECPTEIKISLKKSLKGVRGILENEIEHKKYQLLKDAEKQLRDCSYTVDEYSNKINSIYYKHTFDMPNNYSEILGRGGRIYSELSDLNQSISIGTEGHYDHYLAYCIAGWFIDNIHHSCLDGVSQKKLAKDITDQIFAYLKAYNLN